MKSPVRPLKVDSNYHNATVRLLATASGTTPQEKVGGLPRRGLIVEMIVFEPPLTGWLAVTGLKKSALLSLRQPENRFPSA